MGANSYYGILVTGGAGFIGSHLVDELVGAFDVTVLDDLSTGTLDNLGQHISNKKVRFVKGDILDKTVVADAMHGIDAVFHLAAVTSIPFSVEHPEVTFKVNVDGTRNILETALQGGVKKVVHVSTCAVYGDPKYLPVDEKHPLNPISPYAESKLKTEQVCAEFQEAHGLRITVLRPFNIYGPRQRNDQYAGAIVKFLEALRDRRQPVIYGDGLATRDYIYVGDVVRAFMLALLNDGSGFRVYNVGTGVPTTVNDLCHLIIELSGATGVNPQYTIARKGDILHSYADITRAKADLGFEPRVSIREGLYSLLTDKTKGVF